MQKSTTTTAAAVQSVVLKPTVYETFVRNWSARTATAITSSSTTSPSSPSSAFKSNSRQTTSSFRITAATSVDPRKVTSIGFTTGQVRSTPFCTAAASETRERNLPKTKFERGQKRNMASTQSALPTPEELKIETPIKEIKTAPGVSLTDHQRLLIASVLDLFAGKPSLRKLSLWKPDAVFRDPLTTAEGHKQYAAQWYGLATAFSEITRLSHTVTSSGNPITMDLKTKYVVKGVGTEKTIDSVVDIFVDETTGKIEKVADKWDGEIKDSGFKQALRKVNAVGVPIMVSVPKSIEEEEGKK